jgi:hypothetical protein
MKVLNMGNNTYEDNAKDYGDCFIIDDEQRNIVVYDCGSEYHAERVKSYMATKNISNAYLVLSHNDSDHFNGVETLMTDDRIKAIYTELSFKYKDAILAKLNDDRRNGRSVINAIAKWDANIKSLEPYSSKLKDIYENPYILVGITVVGPKKQYTIDTIEQALNSAESDTKDGTSVHNAASVQVEVVFDQQQKMLLTGDASFYAFDDKVRNYQIVQLPHHGNNDMAQLVFDKMQGKENSTVYFVSDNKGEATGGSANLECKGKMILNTVTDGDITEARLLSPRTKVGSYCAL